MDNNKIKSQIDFNKLSEEKKEFSNEQPTNCMSNERTLKTNDLTDWPSPPSFAEINRPVLLPQPSLAYLSNNNNFPQNPLLSYFPNPFMPYGLPWNLYETQNMNQSIPCSPQINGNQNNLNDIEKINEQISRMMNNTDNNTEKQDKEQKNNSNQFHVRNRDSTQFNDARLNVNNPQVMGMRNDLFYKNKKRINANANTNNHNKASMANLAVNGLVFNELKYLTDLDDKYAKNVLEYFKDELILDSFNPLCGYNKRSINYLFTIIYDYFTHLNDRFHVPAITYSDLIDYRVYPYDDFCMFDGHFTNFLYRSNFFPKRELDDYSEVIAKYKKLYPEKLFKFRKHLINCKREYLKKNRLTNEFSKRYDDKYSIDYKSVTFQPIDTTVLRQNIFKFNDFKRKFKYFESEYILKESNKQDILKFVDNFEHALQEPFPAMSPKVYPFGSISNGLGTRDSDFDLFVKFENLDIDILDYYTSMLTLEIIENIFKDKFNLHFKNSSNIIQSRRCPIIKLNFAYFFPKLPDNFKLKNLKFNKCDISLTSMYGVYNSRLLNFFTKFDKRFYKLTLVLKFWAKTNEIISPLMFSTYAFTMLIIYFLQQLDILPTIDKMLSVKDQEPFLIHKWNFGFCEDISKLPKSKNNDSVPTLLVKFFKFYSNFNFYFYAIRPRFGKAVEKYYLHQEKESMDYTCFNTSSYFVIEDPFVLDHNVAFNFRTKNVYKFLKCIQIITGLINNQNCLDLMVDEPINAIFAPDIYPAITFFKFNLTFGSNLYQLIKRKEAPKAVKWHWMFDFFDYIIDYLLKNYFFMTFAKIQDERELIYKIHSESLNLIEKSSHFYNLEKFINHSRQANDNLLNPLKSFRKNLRLDFDRRKINNNNNATDDICEIQIKFDDDFMDNHFPVFNGFINNNANWLLNIIIILLQKFFFYMDRSNEEFNNFYRNFKNM